MKRTAITAALAASAWATVHRRSPAVQAWQAPDLPIRRHGPLSYRVAGPEDAETGVLLLHGLVATGDVFGATLGMLARKHRVVVPDLLGFGRSLDEHRSDFSTSAHLDALDDLIAYELAGKQIRIGAHSMGSALALRWAAANPDRVERVVCVGPPIWPDADTARAALGQLGPMGRSIILDRRLAHALCAFNCRHRALAGLMSAAIAPRWPIPIARQASLHTWPAYIDTLQEQIIDCPWPQLLDQLATAGIPVQLIRGDQDGIGDTPYIRGLAARPGIHVTTLRGNHTLPAAQPRLLTDALSLT